MEFTSPVYQRYYEEYESVKLQPRGDRAYNLVPESYLLEWMDKPENKEESLRRRKARGMIP